MNQKKKFTISKIFEFEAAHSLPHLPKWHKCRLVHGHSYQVELFFRGELDERGFVIDYSEISEIANPLIKLLDHNRAGRNEDDGKLVLIEDIIQMPSTAENLAFWFWSEIKKKNKLLSKVKIYETRSTCVEFSG